MPAAPDKVLRLVDTFERNQDEYLGANFNEANLRIQFINPLFKALGWDMDNEQGYAEAYKDVIHEASLKIGGETKAPDYCFRIGGTPKFYLEAKKPCVNIKNDPAPAFQLRRYGWSKKLPLSILTDFEEFAVYDCRYRPSKGHVCVTLLLPGSSDMLELSDDVFRRAMALEAKGFKPADAVHVAAAETLGADVLLSCDDRLVRRAGRCREQLGVRVANPLNWLKEIGHDNDA